MSTILHLDPHFFRSRECLLLESGGLRAYAFRYDSGVCALRLENSRGKVTVLPFQGQQVWRAEFMGRELTMRSAFDEPKTTQNYLSTYGGFLLHCGLTAMGVPGPGDSHPLHGELPNAPYDSAALRLGEDAQGRYIALTGTYRHTVAFTVDYSFSPECRLYENGSLLHITVTAQNLRQAAMEYMYLAHINFHPADGGELVYSAHPDPAHVFVHRKFPADMPADARQRLSDYMDAIANNPVVHHKIDPSAQIYNPEICLTLRYEADASGYAHTLQCLPDGYAHYVAHPVAALPYVIRWMSRTGDEDAMGMALPATAEHNGRAKARADGQVRLLGPGEVLHFSYAAGLLSPGQAASTKQHIADILSAPPRA